MDVDMIAKTEPTDDGDIKIEYLRPYENVINNPPTHRVDIIYEPANNNEIEIDETQIKIEPSIEQTSERAINAVEGSALSAQCAPSAYECYACKNSFIHFASLQSHFTQCVLLNSTKAFQCNSCDKSYETKHSLNQHILRKHEEKQFECTECPKKFSYQPELKRHMDTHDGSNICSVCNKKFRWKMDLKRHMNLHLENNPFECSACSKKFSCLAELNRHEAVHTDNRPFSCEVCDKTYKRSGELQRHILTHTKEKKIECEICGKKLLKGNKLKHMTMHDRKKAHSPTPSTSFDSKH